MKDLYDQLISKSFKKKPVIAQKGYNWNQALVKANYLLL